MTHQREPILDFLITHFNYEIVAFKPKQPELDLLLFVRPFTSGVWKGILVVGLFILSIIATSNILLKSISFRDSKSHLLVSLFGWYFFLLLNAYYGGALTMFLANEVTVPFSSVTDVIRAYPKWRLLMVKRKEQAEYHF